MFLLSQFICLGFFVLLIQLQGYFVSNTEASQFWSIKIFHIWNFLYHRVLVWSTMSHHTASELGISLEHPVNGLNGSIKWSWFWCFIILSRQSIHTCFWHNYFITESVAAFAPGWCYLQSLTHWSVSATQAYLVRRVLILAHRLQKILPVKLSPWDLKPEITE